MNITVNQHQFFVDDRGKRIIRSRDGRCCAAASICEFSMQIQSGEQQYALTPEQFSKTPMPDGARYENSILQVQLRYAPRGSAIAKKLSVTAKQPLTLLYMQTEYSRFDEPLRGGGEGQPIRSQRLFRRQYAAGRAHTRAGRQLPVDRTEPMEDAAGGRDIFAA